MILVTGATGKVGTALVEQLRAQGTPFRALAHSETSYERLTAQGVDTVRVADLRSADPAVFAGIDRLFLLTPGGPELADLECGFVDLARGAGVRRVVKVSAFGVDDRSVSLLGPHREAEAYIRASGLEYTLLRPNLFMQTLAALDAPLIREQRAIFNSAGDGRISFIDVRDVAAVAVAALNGEEHAGQTYELTGREALSYGDVAQKLTGQLGHPVRYVPLDDEAYRGALVAAGLSAYFTGGFVDLYRFYREGKAAAVSDAVEHLTGRAAGTMDAYLADDRAAFA